MRRLHASLAFISMLSLMFICYLPIFSSVSISPRSTVILGRVTDLVTYVQTQEPKPIPNASIIIINNWGIVVGANKTDEFGYYNITLNWYGDFNVLAYFDDPSTPGFDYLPAVREISVKAGEVKDCSFSLWWGASVILEGDPLLVETTEPIERFSASVIKPETGAPPSEIMGLFVYGNQKFRTYNELLNIEPQHIVIPANMSVVLDLALKPYGYTGTLQIIVTNETQPFFLKKGDLAKVNMQNVSLERDLQITEDLMTEVDEFLKKAESSGLYVMAEKNRLTQAAGLVSLAREMLLKGDQLECFADLREAYLIASHIRDSVEGTLTEASQSTFAILPFLAFTSVTVAFLFSDKPRRKLSLAFLFYVFFLFFLWITYPGFKLIDPVTAFVVASLSLAAAIFIIVVLPHQYSEMADETGIVLRSAIISAFSLAKRSMRRRRLRSALIFVSIITMIWAFTVLTSVSLDYGVVIKTYPSATTIGEGMLIQDSPAGSAGYFQPVSGSMLQWLMAKPEVKSVAPKAESYPQDRSARLSTTDGETDILINGWLGIMPRNESAVTGFDKLVSHGQFLSDDDVDSILISEGAASALNRTGELKLNANLTLKLEGSGYVKSFVLRGLMEDNGLTNFRDFDGDYIRPKMAVNGVLFPCSSSSIVVMHFKTALTLPSTVLSRIDATVKDEKDLTPLARQVALEKGYETWISLNNGITNLFVGSYAEYEGAAIVIPLSLVIINIVVMMVGTMYERRRESVILSVIGLNPAHIASLYTAEAIILGFIGGTLGYLAGVMSYRVMALLSTAIMVEQKVSITWSIAAVGLSVLASVIASAIPATRAPKVALPSLKLRWKFGEKTVKKPSAKDMPWTVRMPAKIPTDKSQSFFSFLISSMKKYHGGSYESVRNLSLNEEGQEKVRLTFQYAYGDGIFPVTYNELVAKLDKGSNAYGLELRCKSPARSSILARERVYMTASFVRRLVLEWIGIALKKK